ncbi:protein diaphanous homolog 1-like isoform X1 [Hemicordylus capensis]|uniref:protein diaphanous homolog 1-like isoform X1 n=1 Tax=Hemicordylus capensis TaxID=884348 RepID=UPI002302CD1C|nr:protein diaphanous homolog 1-like isoform X1 [Hemicordylus capensis]
MPDDLVPGRPAPVAPLPSPEDPAPVLPAPSLPLPAAPVEPPPVDPRVPVTPGEPAAPTPPSGTGQWPYVPWPMPASGSWGVHSYWPPYTHPWGLGPPVSIPGVTAGLQGAAERVWTGAVPPGTPVAPPAGVIPSPVPAISGTTSHYPMGILPAGYHAPYGGMGLLLGDRLLPATKEKILKGEYIDIFSLLFRKPGVKHKEGESFKDHEATKRKPVEKTWNNWLSGFTIYMGVIVQAQPARGPALLKYMDMIHRAVSDFAGSSWIRYDESFCMRAALDPSLPWDTPLQELWLVIMSQPRPVEGDRSDSGHLLSRAAVPSTSGGAGQQWVQPHLVCWEYNTHGKCTWSPCRFKRACGVCGAKHPSFVCPRAKFSSSGSKFRPGSNNKKGAPPPPPAGKGPQPHQA